MGQFEDFITNLFTGDKETDNKEYSFFELLRLSPWGVKITDTVDNIKGFVTNIFSLDDFDGEWGSNLLKIFDLDELETRFPLLASIFSLQDFNLEWGTTLGKIFSKDDLDTTFWETYVVNPIKDLFEEHVIDPVTQWFSDNIEGLFKDNFAYTWIKGKWVDFKKELMIDIMDSFNTFVDGGLF